MNKNKIRLIFYLPSIKSYCDRAKLVKEIAASTERTTLVVSQVDYPLGNTSNFEVLQVPRPFTFPGSTFFYASKFVRQLSKKNNANVVHDTFGHLLLFFLCKKNFSKTVFITSQYILKEWDLRKFIIPQYKATIFKYRDTWQSLLQIFIQRSLFNLADYCVLQAPGLIQRVTEYVNIPPQKCYWLPNSISTRLPPQSEEIRRSTFKNNSSIELLFVGAFTAGKGAEYLLQLLRRAQERKILMSITTAGGYAAISKGAMEGKVEALNKKGEITVLGKIGKEELFDLYQKKDWLFHVTEVDGSPRVVLEALSQGLPVIGSYHPGITVFDPEEEFILFYDHDRIDSLLDRLVELKANPPAYYSLVNKGMHAVKESFTNEAVSKKYIDLYRQLVNKTVPCPQIQKKN